MHICTGSKVKKNKGYMMFNFTGQKNLSLVSWVKILKYSVMGRDFIFVGSIKGK